MAFQVGAFQTNYQQVSTASPELVAGGWEHYLAYRKRRQKRIDEQEELERKIAAERAMLAEAERQLELKERERRRQEKLASQRTDREIAGLNRSIELNRARVEAITHELGRLLIWQALEQEQAELDRLRYEKDQYLKEERRRRNNVVLALLLDS